MAVKVNMKINFEKSLKEKKILSGLVVECEGYQTTESEQECILRVNCLGTLVTIPESEIIDIPTRMTPRRLVGENINFTIIDIKDDIIIGSMKEASEILKKPILEKLQAGETMKGIITYLTPYGAYINIGGVLSGLMKNYDFSDDGTEIREIYKKYDTIDVKYKALTTNGNILFLPVMPKKGKQMYEAAKIKENESFLGKVIEIPVSYDYVRVIIDGNNLKVKCYYPSKYPDIKVGDMVVVVINRNYYDEEKGKHYLFGRITNRVRVAETSYNRI